MDVAWHDVVLSLGVGVGLAAAAGLRVFVPLLLLGGAARLGWMPLLDRLDWRFDWLATDLGLAVLGVATVLEICGYYIPVVDNALDAVAAPLAVIAGVVLTAAVTVDLPPVIRWSAAIIAGGGTAGLVHTLTSVARLKSTAVTAGFGNPVLATLELVGSVVMSIVVIVVPALALVAVAGLVLLVRRIRRARLRKAGLARV
jgi:hypothetical protein